MSQSLAKIITHAIFSTKHREPIILPEIRKDLCSYLGGILTHLESPPIEINCTADHTHMLFCLSKNHSIANVIKEAKQGSSKWIKTQSPLLQNFYWQGGYGSFSVSQSMITVIRKYISNQEEHHRKVSFQEEFRAFLKRHQIEFDERYVWD